MMCVLHCPELLWSFIREIAWTRRWTLINPPQSNNPALGSSPNQHLTSFLKSLCISPRFLSFSRNFTWAHHIILNLFDMQDSYIVSLPVTKSLLGKNRNEVLIIKFLSGSSIYLLNPQSHRPQKKSIAPICIGLKRKISTVSPFTRKYRWVSFKLVLL